MKSGKIHRKKYRVPTTEALNALKTVFKNSWPTLLTRINAMENGSVWIQAHKLTYTNTNAGSLTLINAMSLNREYCYEPTVKKQPDSQPKSSQQVHILSVDVYTKLYVCDAFVHTQMIWMPIVLIDCVGVCVCERA